MEDSFPTNECFFRSHDLSGELTLIGHKGREQICFRGVYLEHPASDVSTQIGQVPLKLLSNYLYSIKCLFKIFFWFLLL